MIRFMKTDMFESQAEAYVNTVNTFGKMGKGLAAEFKKRFPENFEQYENACTNGVCIVGKMFVTERMNFFGPKYIINFPTKRFWKHKTDINYIRWGLIDLVKVIPRYCIRSIAIPALGCGEGGLKWDKVKPLIVESLENLNIDIEIYEPHESNLQE